MVAQKAATVDEALEIVRSTPRMRGQALVIGHRGDTGAGISPDAAVVLYDADTVEVIRQTNGLAVSSSVGTSREDLLPTLQRPDREAIDAIRSVGTSITLHSVAVRPDENAMWVAHGLPSSAHRGEYVRYDLGSLLER
jgi:hypothetical protein